MRVDESGDHQLSARVNHLVGSAVEALADKDDLRALVDEFGVAPQHVAAARIADKPAALDLRSHVALLLWAGANAPPAGSAHFELIRYLVEPGLDTGLVDPGRTRHGGPADDIIADLDRQPAG